MNPLTNRPWRRCRLGPCLRRTGDRALQPLAALRGVRTVAGAVRMLFACVVALIVPVAPAQQPAQQPAEEHWAGTIVLGSTQRLDFHLHQQQLDGGQAQWRLDIPSQRLQSAALLDGERRDGRLRFTLGPPNPKTAFAEFECVVVGNQAVGVMLQTGKVFRVAMRRTVDAAAVGWAGDLPEDPFARWSMRVDLGNGLSLRCDAHLAVAPSPQVGAGWITIPAQASLARLHDIASVDGELQFTFRPAEAATTWALFKLRPGEGGRALGTMQQLGRTMPVHALEQAELPRLQDPVAPFPYDEVEVSIATPDPAVRLAGTLTVPHGKAPHPAALLLTGSGSQDRDETIHGHKPFRLIADRLARGGVAVLRVDDRGTANSTGNAAAATTKDLAADAAACLRFLSGRDEIDARKIGLIGHSEGAWLAFLVAAGSAGGVTEGGAVAWIVTLGGPGLSGRETVLYQVSDGQVGRSADAAAVAAVRDRMTTVLDRLAGADEPALREAVGAFLAAQRRLRSGGAAETVDSVLARIRSPWYRFFVQYDPAVDLERLRIPILALNGELDCQVRAAENLERIARVSRDAGNQNVETLVVPGLNHMFQTAPTGAMSEYGMIEETFHEPTLASIVDWVRRRSALDR